MTATMAIIIDGKAVSKSIREKIKSLNAERMAKGARRPGLAVILVGDDPASAVYVRNKKRACDECDFYSLEKKLPEETSEEELLGIIDALNKDDNIDGILVQLPLPKHINEEKVIAAIDPSKDVDAFSFENVGRIVTDTYSFLPCTPAGVMELLDAYAIDPSGKEVVIVGRSNIVGKPQALLMLHRNATVTITHSKTKDLAAHTRRADIIVVAIGRAKFLKADMVKDGAVVIDVGINRMEDKSLCGDVDFEEVAKKASFITPVPGGVGPMTITMLMKNTLTAADLHSERE